MNAATNRFAGRSNSALGRVALLHRPVAQHRDAVAERHRLDLVVGDVDGRDAEPLVQPRELGAHADAQLRVEVRERLVHQVRLRLAHHRAADRDALALAARQRARLAVDQLREPQHAGDRADAAPASPASACAAA